MKFPVHSSASKCIKQVVRMAATTVLMIGAPTIYAAGPQSASSPKGQNPAYQGHGEGSVAPAILEKFKPGSIDTEMGKKIEQAMDIRSPGGGLLAPDGKTLYFTWNVTGTRQIWQSSKDSSFPIQLTAGNDQVSIGALSKDGAWLTLSRDEAGKEYPSLFLMNAKTKVFTLVFAKPNVRASSSHFSQDSKTFYYMANDTSPTAYSAFAYDVATGKSRRLFTQEGVWSIADYIRNDQGGDDRWLMVYAKGNTASEFHEYDLKTGKFTHLFGQGEDESYEAVYGPTGSLVVSTNKFSDFHRLYSWNGKQGFQPLTPEISHDVAGFQIDQAKKRLLYTVNEKGYFKLFGIAAGDGQALPRLPNFPGASSVWLGSETEDGRYGIFSVGYSNRPSEPWVYDWQTGQATQWVRPSAPEADAASAVTASLQEYKSRDGAKIPMFVYQPKSCLNKSCPVIVDFHGGPEGQSLPIYNPLDQLLLAQEYVLIYPNVRGSSGYGKKWLDSDNGRKRLDVIADIEDVALHVKKNFAKGGTTPKVGVMGGSYGGYATLMAMTRFAGAYDAGVAIVGMSNLVTFLENTAPYRRQLRVTEYGDPAKDLEALKQLSPMTYLDRMKSPLMIIQGANDPRVPAGEAVQVYDALQAKKIPAELILFSDEGHGVAKRSNRVLYYGHLINFFNTHLKANTVQTGQL